MLSAVSHIPQTPLFGRSPDGMNSTGESDLQNYYDYCGEIQTNDVLDNTRKVVELVFRGIIYGKARDIFGVPAAMVFSGLIFGIYHGNLVQGIYAAFLGTVLAWTMEHTGTLLAPMIFHGIGNITVFLLIDAAGLGGALARPWICAALLFISVVCFLQLLKGGKAGKSQSSIL